MVEIRRGGPDDLKTLSMLRARMFATFYDTDPQTLAAADQDFFLSAMSRGDAAFWLAEDEARAVACGALSLYHLPPKPFSLKTPYAYLSSMWTEPEYRRQGVGRQIMELAVEFARQCGASHLSLHSTEAGRSVYSRFGFDPTNEMRLPLLIESE
ncbi:GNAT family N-acetyltransferase [Desulfovibrio ferrophilus]|uniref:GCN5-related N-acetyltransferase n=1 Tax=Desulfovibrio ferrophilus TaxID=241368 RepID=A0A2Z6AYA5_9BACT|nr:GNAT family N-acetyltransferase [Desulfovibrio ferrophilus]BBD08136.1 GCN5-related N-acetyltransferase [Desulfovibrio ferrophilus]